MGFPELWSILNDANKKYGGEWPSPSLSDNQNHFHVAWLWAAAACLCNSL
jgi:hypothetical protein